MTSHNTPVMHSLPATPITARIFSAAIVLLGILAMYGSRSQAQAPLTESAIIEAAQAVAPEVDAAAAEMAIAQADGTAGGLYPNPEFAWEREHYPGVEAEDRFALTIPIELSGRRSARQGIAHSRTLEREAQWRQTRSQVVVRALMQFYRVIALKERIQVEEESMGRLREASRVLHRRREEGTVSGYEHNRLLVEVSLAESEMREAMFEAERAENQLRRLLSIPEGPLSGTLEAQMPEAQAEPGAPSVESLQRSVAASLEAQDDAEFAWFPQLSLTGGLLLSHTDETRLGLAVGVELELPFFSAGQELSGLALGQRQSAEARLALHRRDLDVATAEAAAELRFALEEVGAFFAATGEPADDLVRAAESAYREGRRSIVELLDAVRARATAQQRYLSLRLRSKQAEVRLRAAQGEFE